MEAVEAGETVEMEAVDTGEMEAQHTQQLDYLYTQLDSLKQNMRDKQTTLAHVSIAASDLPSHQSQVHNIYQTNSFAFIQNFCRHFMF